MRRNPILTILTIESSLQSQEEEIRARVFLDLPKHRHYLVFPNFLFQIDAFWGPFRFLFSIILCNPQLKKKNEDRLTDQGRVCLTISKYIKRGDWMKNPSLIILSDWKSLTLYWAIYKISILKFSPLCQFYWAEDTNCLENVL